MSAQDKTLRCSWQATWWAPVLGSTAARCVHAGGVFRVLVRDSAWARAGRQVWTSSLNPCSDPIVRGKVGGALRSNLVPLCVVEQKTAVRACSLTAQWDKKRGARDKPRPIAEPW